MKTSFYQKSRGDIKMNKTKGQGRFRALKSLD